MPLFDILLLWTLSIVYMYGEEWDIDDQFSFKHVEFEIPLEHLSGYIMLAVHIQV